MLFHFYKLASLPHLLVCVFANFQNVFKKKFTKFSGADLETILNINERVNKNIEQ